MTEPPLYIGRSMLHLGKSTYCTECGEQITHRDIVVYERLKDEIDQYHVNCLIESNPLKLASADYYPNKEIDESILTKIEDAKSKYSEEAKQKFLQRYKA